MEKGELRACHQQQANNNDQHAEDNQKLSKLGRNHMIILPETGSPFVAPTFRSALFCFPDLLT
jgi:hypothetical protein